MKRPLVPLTVALGASLVCASAQAASNVTLWGVLDGGVTYVSNERLRTDDGRYVGKNNVMTHSGLTAGSKWGLRGVEDIGGGNKVIFELRSGFNLGTGRGGGFRTRAWAGFDTPAGQLTFGRQAESLNDFLGKYTIGDGLNYGAHFGGLDNLGANFSLDNAIKFRSPNFNGITFGGTYAHAGKPGKFGADRAWSIGAAYDMSGLSVGLGYLYVSNPLTVAYGGDSTKPTYRGALDGYSGGFSCNKDDLDYCSMHAAKKLKIFAAGGAYQFDKLKLGLTYSRTQLDDYLNFVPIPGDVLFNIYEVNASYQLTPALMLSAAYIYNDGHLKATHLRPKFHQVNLFSSYSLSKRSSIYTAVVYQRAVGDGISPDDGKSTDSLSPRAQIPGLPMSNNNHQLAVAVGLRHNF